MSNIMALWKSCELMTYHMKLYFLKKCKRNYDKFEYKALKTEYKDRIRALKKEIKGRVV